MRKTNLVRALLCLMVMLGTTLGSCKKDELVDFQKNEEAPVMITAKSKALPADAVYIDPTYTGTKSGTINQPFASFSEVTWKAGGTYVVKSGTVYSTSTKIRPNANNITIGSYGTGNRPIIRCSASGEKIFDLGALSNVTIQDLEVVSTNKAITCFHFFNSVGGTLSNVKMSGSTWGARNVNSTGLFRIINCEIHTTEDDGVFISDVESVEVAGSRVYDVNRKWYVNSSESYSGGDVIQLVNVKTFNIHDNYLDHGVTGNKFCLIVNSSIAGFNATGKIERNTFTRNGSGILLYMNLASNVLVRYNKFQNGDIAIYNHTNNPMVYYNEFSNIKDKILAGGGPKGSDSRYFNNTFYNVNRIIESYTENVNFQNNIVYNCPGQMFTGSSNIKASNNCYFQANPGSYSGTGSITADPQFVNAAAGDFKLKSTSPCINKGATVLTGYTDMLNIAVPFGGATDMGANEYNGGATTPPPTTPPPTTPPPATGNKAPTVSITSPANGFSAVAPASITLTANAADVDGSIARVEFFYGSTKIGEKTASPYSINWQVTQNGNYTLTAVATDNAGLKSTSAVVNISITSGTTTPPPTSTGGAIVYHDANYTGTSAVLAPGNYNLAALNSKGITNDKISSLRTRGYQVIVYKNDNFSGSSAVFTIDNNNLTSAGYNDQISSIKVVALGTSIPTTPSTPTTNKLPVVSINTPSNGQNFTYPASIQISASASDSDGSIAKVEFYNGTTKIGEDTTSPYSITWSNGGKITKNEIKAVATDNMGGKTTSLTKWVYIN